MNLNAKIHLPFLDGIRGIAILWVFFFHCLGATFGFDKLPWHGLFRDFDVPNSFLLLLPFSYGYAGVAIFFVVSGFCIHLSHQRSKDKSWALFANKRFFRIYPPYLLAIGIFFFVTPWGAFSIDGMEFGVERLTQLSTHIFAIHNYWKPTFFGINPSFWSIAVELQLYAIYPLLFLLVKRLGWKRTLIIVGIVEVSLRLWGSINSCLPILPSLNGLIPIVPKPRFIGVSPFAYWLSWSLGAYLCDCYLAKKSSRLFQIRFDLMCLLALLIPLFRPTAPFSFLAFSLLTAVAIERLMMGRWKVPENKAFKLCWTHLSFLGVVSYSFYLFHQPFLGITNEILSNLFPATLIHPLAKYVACLAWYPVILLLSYGVYRFVEKPSVSLGKMVWNLKSRPDK